MKIILSSKNKDKVKITRKALKELHLEVEVKGVAVRSGTEDQPLDKEATKKGAVNRAKDAKKANPSADFWIGLEGGLHDYGEGYHLVTFACLIDKSGDKYFGEGEEIHLPEEVSQKVKKGQWFGKAIREYAKDNKIDQNLITRLSPLIRAVQSAYTDYLKETGDLQYRNRSAAVIIDDEENFLIVQLMGYGENDWNFSGGGIEDGEKPKQALVRELEEELSTNKFKVLKKSKHKEQYDWPNWLIANDISKRKPNIYRGQEVTYFLVKFTGEKEEIKSDPKEIRKIKWIKREEIKDHFNFPRQEKTTKKVLNDLLS